MPVKKGTCQFPVTRKLDSELCGEPGTWRERVDHGMTYGYYLCDSHWEVIEGERINGAAV